MAYQLTLSLSPAEAVGQVVNDQLQKALHQLKEQPEGLHEAVHDARKRLKKVRAVLRLLRPGLGEKQYKALNTFYRDAGRKLAPLRDAFVRQQTLALLREQHQDKLKTTVFQAMHQRLKDDLQVLEGVAGEEKLLDEVHELLEEGQRQLEQWLLQDISWQELLRGHLKSYARAHAALPNAYKVANPEAFHEWRKRVKYCWYHYRLLKELWPPVLNVLAKEMHKLASLLGDAHDMSRFLAYQPDGVPNELLQWAAQHEREQLRKQALPMGKRLLAIEPKQHNQQLQTWLDVQLQQAK